MTESAPGFYGTYASHKGYTTPELGKKQVRRFDVEIWRPASCETSMSFLEIGCGTGAFLAYLHAKGVSRLLGIDHDRALAQVIPEAVRERFSCRDAHELLADGDLEPFDRVVMLDVLEHFSPEEACHLLQSIRGKLAPGGKVVVKVPNMGAPWGLQYQFGDLTHRTAFSPIALRQLADAAGYGAPLIYAQTQGSRRRRFTDALVHGFLSWALLTPPEFWSANLYAVIPLRPQP